MLSSHGARPGPELLERRRTPLERAERLGQAVGFSNLYLKLEGATPSGSHKHRMAQAAVTAMLERGAPGIAVASCGHAGVSLASLCGSYGISCRVFAPAGWPVDLPLSPHVVLESSYRTYEEAVLGCDRWTRRTGFLNATAGRDLSGPYRTAYAPVAEEIIATIGDAPDVVVCPAGNGTTFASIYTGFHSSRTRLPRHFAVTVPENGFSHPCAPPQTIDWSIEPLRSSYPLDRVAALRAATRSGGAIVTVGRDEIGEAVEAIRECEAIDCHPSSAAPVAALPRLREAARVAAAEVVVVVLTTGAVGGR